MFHCILQKKWDKEEGTRGNHYRKGWKAGEKVQEAGVRAGAGMVRALASHQPAMWPGFDFSDPASYVG